MLASLAEEPYQGKPLGVAFFREKKFKGKRLYYRIYEDEGIVLLLAVSNKKAQQRTIDALRQQ